MRTMGKDLIDLELVPYVLFLWLFSNLCCILWDKAMNKKRDDALPSSIPLPAYWYTPIKVQFAPIYDHLRISRSKT